MPHGPSKPETMTVREVADWWMDNDPVSLEQDTQEVKDSFSAAARAALERQRTPGG